MSPTRRRWILVTVALATFMTYLDNNIVNVALPTMQRHLHLSVAGLEWVVSAYILMFASLLLLGGRLADLWGQRRLFLIGLSIFTLASLAAGLSSGVEVLIASRALQGVGAALVTPTTLGMISSVFSETRERNAAVGAWNAVGALALALGPLLGGLISEHLTWGWIFLINVPVGVATLALGSAVLPARTQTAGRPIDALGLALSSLSLFSLTYALIEGPRLGWSSPDIAACFVVAAVSAVAFAAAESRASDPMIPMKLFRERVFVGGTIAVMMWAFGLFGIYFYTSLDLQGVLGFSPVLAGLSFLPMALLMVVGAVASEPLARRVGAARLVSLAMFVMAAGIASAVLLGRHTSFLALMPSFAVIGVGGGLTTPLIANVLGVMPPEDAGIASGIFNASREVAGLLGITLIGVVVSAREAAVARHVADPAGAFLSGYRLGLLAAAALVAAGGAAAWSALHTLKSPVPDSLEGFTLAPWDDGVVTDTAR
jgi:EmrB/QacA subfamily drug resistance transporter